MNTGMLWFDNDPKTGLTTKIKRAVDYYHKKYGRKPNLCLIHPTAFPPDGTLENPASVGGAGEKPKAGKPALSGAEGVVIRPYRPVLPGHMWIGIEEKN